MKEIGIRELKARASEIVRKVAEERASYTVTRRGRPVGVLGPAGVEPPGVGTDSEEAWERFERLADRLAARRGKRSSALDELAVSRR